MILWIEIAVVAAAVVTSLWFCLRARDTRRKLHYVIEASLSNDFSYQFSESNREGVNALLNRMVVHLSMLADKARSTDAYYGLILDQTVTGIIVVDDNDNVSHANAAALALLGIEVLTHLAQLQQRAPTVYSALAMGLESCTVDCKELTMAVIETTLAGKLLRIVAINDISRPMQSREDASWVKLTRVLTHEIMNSLTPISSITESLQERAQTIDSNELTESLGIIATCNKSLLSFVKGFRKFTILPEPRRSAFDLKPFLQEIIVLGQEMSSSVTFSLSVDQSDIMLYADRSMICQVMVNLVKNAVEAHPSKISILAAVSPDESVKIDIENDGEIIPREIAEQIFVPFFTTRSSGSGIGLSLSRRYVIANGGSLTLSSRAPTRFTITL